MYPSLSLYNNLRTSCVSSIIIKQTLYSKSVCNNRERTLTSDISHFQKKFAEKMEFVKRSDASSSSSSSSSAMAAAVTFEGDLSSNWELVGSPDGEQFPIEDGYGFAVVPDCDWDSDSDFLVESLSDYCFDDGEDRLIEDREKEVEKEPVEESNDVKKNDAIGDENVPECAAGVDLNVYVHYHEEEADEVDDEEEEKEEDGYDLDDELVPRYVNDRFGRDRMRKLGKRLSTKVAKSKRSPYLHTTPGCVRGKHGLGLKYKF